VIAREKKCLINIFFLIIGQLRTSTGNLLPHDPATFCPSTRQCFKAGVYKFYNLSII